MSSPPHPQADNFVEHLSWLARTRPEDVGLIVVDKHEGEFIERSFSYREFERRVRALGACLQARVNTGERVLILLDNDEHYAIGMFGCFYAGVIAVPVFRPESARPQHLARLAAIAADARTQGILTLAATRAVVAQQWPTAQIIAVDDIDTAAASQWSARTPQENDIAFLQYTSGSTATPKGVMVSHANLIANERALAHGMRIGPRDTFCVWSPLFHDMGLIGGLLQPFFSGVPCVLTSPQYFLQRPLRWLELIARHRVTVSGGPDFAYRLCVERVKETPAIDLSSWRVAYTGAEPVRHDTMEAFVARFGPAGFRAEAVYPCYGLAEATLFVSGVACESGMDVQRFCAAQLARGEVHVQPEGTPLVSCGEPPPRHEVRIVEPQTGGDEIAGRIGEIRVAGPSIALGYWHRRRETEQTFVERDGRRWLRTGDLGFVHDGQLYVTGRIKDMMIVRGQNIYPQDIEHVVETQVQAARKGRVAAFAVTADGSEAMGVAAEVSRGTQKRLSPRVLVDAISKAMAEHTGEPPEVIVLLNPGGLPKTSSGKLQRSACRNGWRERSLDAYALYEHRRFVFGGRDIEQRPLSPAEQQLSALWREVLKDVPEAVHAHDAHYFAVGGNSLNAALLAARLSEQWHVDIPVRFIYEQPNLDAMAQALTSVAASGANPALIIHPVAAERRAAPLPLSHAQERQWFLWHIDPQGSAYHIALVLRLAGTLDVLGLEAACNALITRHEVLRTVFRSVNGVPMQHLQATASVPVSSIDLRAEPHADRESLARSHSLRLQSEPFDLTAGPLLRVAVLRLAEEVQWLVLVTHHIVADGASMQLLADELATSYAAHRQGNAEREQAPCLQYLDYALWQRDWLAQGEGARQLAWWRQQLGREQPVLALQTDHPRRPQVSYRARRHAFELPASLREQLQQSARMHGSTLFTWLLSGLQALLYRYTGQSDIRIGVPVAHRHPRTATLLGLFVNTLVLRNVIDGRMSLAQVAEQASETMRGAQLHADIPFEQLVQALQPGRSLAHCPLVQVTLNHVRLDASQLEHGFGVRLLGQEVLHQVVHFDLTLELIEGSDGSLAPSFIYCAELFEPATIAALSEHYVAILHRLAHRPQTALADVPLLNAGELESLQHGAGAEPAPSVLFAHQRFEQQAVLTPDALAVIKNQRSLTYGELNSAANALAHRMLRLGIGCDSRVGRDGRVGICMDRSVEMIVCLLATLKAGAAYIPLDPAYPQERLAYMLRDSDIALLLSQHSLRARAPATAVPVLYVDEVTPADMQAACNPDVPLHEQSLAYVIYTSGSAGMPKGVEVTHGPLARHLQAISRVYGVEPSHRELFFFSLSFDAAVEQWLTPLCGGGAVVLCDAEQLAAQSFVDLIMQHGITTLHLPPAYLRVIAPLAQRAQIKLRTCIVGGEALTWADCALARQALGAARVVNAYGPTETIITPTAWACEPHTAIGTGNAPIGQPVAGRRVYVLDEHLNRVPRGVAGELYVGGMEIARGYAGRAALTATRFIADPFDTRGGRLYRTGDVVRWRSDGQLEYFGRADQQVKVRGFRIELGEIEAQLLNQPGVREAVAVVHGSGGDERIHAYVCAHADMSLDPERLRDALRETLPDYMLPSRVIVLEQLPLTPNGKVDRTVLPLPRRESSELDATFATALEAKLAAIWAEALGTAQFTRQDNFFDLGGHSLSLIQVHSRLREQLGAEVTLLELFQYTTIAALAAFLAREPSSQPQVEQRIQERASRQRSHFIRRPGAAAGQPT